MLHVSRIKDNLQIYARSLIDVTNLDECGMLCLQLCDKSHMVGYEDYTSCKI